MTDRTAEEQEAGDERPGDDASATTEGDATNDAEERTDDSNDATTSEPGDGDGESTGDGRADEQTEEQASETTDSAAETADSAAESSAASLVSRVESYDEALADQVQAELEAGERTAADLREQLRARDERIEELEAQVEGLEGKLKRKQADFQNFKKRQQKKVSEQRARATEDLLQRLLPVRDNLVRALEQDEDTDIRDGVEGTLREFDRVLDAEDVTAIDPDPGEKTDPSRHEVMMRVESDQPAGTVVDVYRPGYEMDERVVRTAQVTVSEGTGEE